MQHQIMHTNVFMLLDDKIEHVAIEKNPHPIGCQ